MTRGVRFGPIKPPMRPRVVPLIGALALLLACERTPEAALQTGGTQEPAPLGEFSAVDGDVSRRRDKTATEAKVGAGLIAGDSVVTRAASKARVDLDEGSVIAVGPDSTLTLERYSREPKKRRGKLRVLAGQFWFRVSELLGTSTDIEVQTPTAVAGIRGTTVWGDVSRDLFCALAGEVELTVNGKAETLAPGECMSKMKSGAPKKVTPDAKTVGGFLQEVHIGTPLEAR